jgi:hypothetical protein
VALDDSGGVVGVALPEQPVEAGEAVVGDGGEEVVGDVSVQRRVVLRSGGLA